MLNFIQATRTAVPGLLVAALALVTQAHAGDVPAASPTTIITPGFGTLGGFFQWVLWLLG
ncbi:MAG: hypothetical protein JNL30_00290 [Rubrivivax sp.]|nr:hypothetical protein [Rubrivivax sp.]